MSFPWAYIDKNSALSASGPTGSLQFKTHDVGGNTSLTGSHNLIFHTASSLLALTGTMELVGTASANQINVNVVDKTVTNFSASGDTKFGAETTNIHRFTGSVNIGGALSASSDLFAAGIPAGGMDPVKVAFRVSGPITATGSIKTDSFVSSSGEVYGTSLRTSGGISFTGSVSGSSSDFFVTGGMSTSGVIRATGSVSSSAEAFGYSLRTSGDINITGTMTSGLIRAGDVSSSARVFGAGLETSGDLGVSGSIRNAGFVSSSGEVYGTALRTSDDVDASGTIKNLSFVSSSGEVFSVGGLRNSGTGDSNFAFSGTLNNKSFISSSGETFAVGGLRASGSLGVNGLGLHVSGSTDFKNSKAATDYASISGTFEVTGAADSLIILHTQDTDALREIAFKKAGTIQSSFGIDSDEHVFIENESTKDIILRTQNQNTIRIFGNQQAVEINGAGVTANATLDVNGDTTFTGSLTVSGTVSFGDTLSNDVLFVSGTLTASKGISLQENSFLPLDKKILFTGSALNASASFMSSSNRHFSISGSLPGGTILRGAKLTLDHTDLTIFPAAAEKGIVLSGAVGGPGSFLGVNDAGQITLTTAVATPPGGDKAVQFNKDGSFSGSANLQFDYDDNELSQVGTFEVKSGSSPASAPVIFEVDGEDGIQGGRARGKFYHIYSLNFNLTSNAQSNKGRFLPFAPAGGGVGLGAGVDPYYNGALTNSKSVLNPSSGRVIMLMWRFEGNYNSSQALANPPLFFMRVGSILGNGIAGNSFTGTEDADGTSAIHSVTASAHPGQYVVGGIDFRTGVGALTGFANITGSWSFGTGSLMNLHIRTPSGGNAPGNAYLTIVCEYDHLTEYVSGSGN